MDSIYIDFTNYLPYKFKKNLSVGKFGVIHFFRVFYFNVEVYTDNREIYQLGFNLKF